MFAVVLNKIKKLIKSVINGMGYDFVKYIRHDSKSTYQTHLTNIFPVDFEADKVSLIKEVIPFTLTSCERIYTLINAVEYITKNNIEGDIIECGVWKGGSMLAIAKTLIKMGDQSRHLYLFDTFSGMPDPSPKDYNFEEKPAIAVFQESDIGRAHPNSEISLWCNASLEEVQAVMYQTGYAPEKLHFVQGKVEETIPDQSPRQIALLRLDTDWYESTRHELIHLFPLISQQGVLIIDDYGYWKGAKLATDEYFQQHQIKIFLNRIDDTGRLVIKP